MLGIFNASPKRAQRPVRGPCPRAPITSPQARVAFRKMRNELHVVRHREDVHDAERTCDPLRSPALKRPNWPLTCGDAVLGDCGRRNGAAGLCESKRAHSEPSCQRAPTFTNDCSQPPRHRTPQTRPRARLRSTSVACSPPECVDHLGRCSQTRPGLEILHGSKRRLVRVKVLPAGNAVLDDSAEVVVLVGVDEGVVDTDVVLSTDQDECFGTKGP